MRLPTSDAVPPFRASASATYDGRSRDLPRRRTPRPCPRVNERPPPHHSAASAARRGTDDPRVFLIPERALPPGFAEKVEAGTSVPVAPRPAATVLLARDAEGGPEVLLLRRHGRSGFAADAWVFPGGTVDEADREPALTARIDGPPPEAWAARLDLADASEAAGYVAAALR